MSTNIWKVKRFTQSTIRTAKKLFDLVIHEGLDFQKGCSFVAYTMETIRQRGGGRTRSTWSYRNPKTGKMVNHTDAGSQPEDLLQMVIRSKFRFMKGRHKEHYFIVGKRLLQSRASEVGLIDNAPAEMVWDLLLEGKHAANYE